MTPDFAAYDPNYRPVRTHAQLDAAFHYLNAALFDGALPPCLITMQRTRHAYGYFSSRRFVNIDNPDEVVDEIALNPIHFSSLLTTNVLATLAHEMAHLWQDRFGKPSRGGYHNTEWARKMNEIGLAPSSTGEPGGKTTGEQMSHYVRPDGPFEKACAGYLQGNTTTLFQDRAYREVVPAEGAAAEESSEGQEGVRRLEKANRDRERKAASKTRFTCPRCKRNAWAAPSTKLLCGNEGCDGEGMRHEQMANPRSAGFTYEPTASDSSQESRRLEAFWGRPFAPRPDAQFSEE